MSANTAVVAELGLRDEHTALLVAILERLDALERATPVGGTAAKVNRGKK